MSLGTIDPTLPQTRMAVVQACAAVEQLALQGGKENLGHRDQ
jgi:hypothetical protein